MFTVIDLENPFRIENDNLEYPRTEFLGRGLFARFSKDRNGKRSILFYLEKRETDDGL